MATQWSGTLLDVKKVCTARAIFCRGWSLKGQIEVKQWKESVAGGGGGREKGHFEGQSQAEALCGLVHVGLMAQGDVRGSQSVDSTLQGLSPSHTTSCGSCLQD